ncbi:hypothetical protein [Mycobacterium sp. MMS18-G62]
MTGPEDSHSSTRPISVAELLAKNGTIGAPPVGGRRRRRRGNSDAVTVAELTGEIPIVTDRDVEETAEPEPTAHDEHADATGPVSTNGAVEHVEEAEAEAEAAPADEYDEVDDAYADAVADYSAHIEQRDAEQDPVDFFSPPRRPHYAHAARRFRPSVGVGAEQMSPDPVVDDDEDVDAGADLIEPPEIEDVDTATAVEARDRDELPSYLRSSQGPLFGGQTVADDLARRGAAPTPEDIDLEDAETQEDAHTAAPAGMSSFLRGALIVGQCIIAVAFGAGLFVAFDQLWKWNNIVALVLSVLVILGLVVGVRVVRKTEDIGSTLIAVAVGALVTLGPLALLQSG